MVKIRLRRIGTKARPFYRVVVTPDKSGRNGRFVEVIGTYNPVSKPKVIKIDEDRAMHWLMLGAQPSETAAILLNKTGVLERFLSERPAKRKDYRFLDKRTAASSVASVMDTKAAAAPAPEPEPVAEEPVAVVEAIEELPADEAVVAEPADAEVEAPAEETPEAVEIGEEAPADEQAAEEGKNAE